MDESLLDSYCRTFPPQVDMEAIRRKWQALRPPFAVAERGLPLPVWARRAFDDDGLQAWQTLCRDASSLPLDRPFCVYVHVPFCSSRCSFCDCYAFRLGDHKERHTAAYVALLEREMDLWARAGVLARRPVSTVHLGGGTPTFLGEQAFARLIGHCRACFSTGPATEWALETTSSELTPEMFDMLTRLGFTRLHIGVQSLQDEVRQRIKRREPAASVMEKIRRAVDDGWIVSVDLIYGLPGQTAAGMLNDISVLADGGVDGFSLYELQLSSQNRAFAEQFGLRQRPRLLNYLLLQAAEQWLGGLGYRKTLFNHFARARDRNLYFTFPERGEDCLALGAIADGVFGDYHYRHPEYTPYCRSVGATFPGLQGGLRRTAQENRLQPLEVSLMSARLAPALWERTMGRDQAHKLLAEWQEAGLVQSDGGDGFCLTGNGSWFTGVMMSQLSDAQHPQRPRFDR